MLSDIWRDLCYGVRTLARIPGFTAVAVLSLALGIGGTSAIFSVVNAIMLRPPPFKDPGRVVVVSISEPRLDEAPGDNATARWTRSMPKASTFLAWPASARWCLQVRRSEASGHGS